MEEMKLNDIEQSETESKEIELDNNGYDEPDHLTASWRRKIEIIAGLYTFIIIAVFPLFFRHYYFDILQAKYIFYYGISILMISSVLFLTIFYLYVDGTKNRWTNLKLICKCVHMKNLRKSDWAMIAFVGAAVISTFQSEYFYESFWGNEGRYMGLFLILIYGISYFIISRFLKFKQAYLDAFLAAGMIACLIGLLQYFNIDPIGFKTDIDYREYRVFSSTIGNINFYASYLALIAGMAVVLFTTEQNTNRKTWYLFNVVISFLSLIICSSDNVYLTLLALFGLLPIYLFNNLSGVKKYALMISILFTSFQVVAVINSAFPDYVLGVDGMFNMIVGFQFFVYLIIIMWGITIFLYSWDARLSKQNNVRKESNVGRWIWLGCIVFLVLCVIFVLYDVNIAGNSEKYGSLKQYLLINDDWGTHRWYIWKIGMKSYQNFPLIHKIFGYGPDTFGIVTVNNYYDEMTSRYREIFDSAHNEYLQYLITIGIAGLAAYLSLLLTSIVQMIRSSKKQPLLMGIVFALIGYGAQAVVNISIPIVSPIMITLLMVGVSAGGYDI